MDDQSSQGSFVDHGLEAEMNKQSLPQWSVKHTNSNLRGGHESSASRSSSSNNHNKNNNDDDDYDSNNKISGERVSSRGKWRQYRSPALRGVGTRSRRLLEANRRLESVNAALDRVNRSLVESNRLLARHNSALVDAVSSLTQKQDRTLFLTEELQHQMLEIKAAVQLLIQKE